MQRKIEYTLTSTAYITCRFVLSSQSTVFILQWTVGIQDGRLMSNRMITLCTYMTPLYAVVNTRNLQSITYQQILFRTIIYFKAMQQFNKRSWYSSDQFCISMYIKNYKFCATNNQRNINYINIIYRSLNIKFLISSALIKYLSLHHNQFT